MVDRCGSSGDHWLQKLNSKLIPDSMFGVSLVVACTKHDKQWEKGANKSADIDFFNDILDSFYMHVQKKSWKEYQKTLFFFVLGYFTATLYYLGVRFGGLFYKLARSQKFKRFVAMLEKVSPEIQAIGLAVLIAMFRIIYDRKETHPVRVISEAAICGLLTKAFYHSVVALDLSPDWAITGGGVIGFLGTYTVRAIAHKLINKKIQ